MPAEIVLVVNNWILSRGCVVCLHMRVLVCTCRYAVANTRRGIESCGLLAGTLLTDADGTNMFRIDTLIIPKQEGTSDTVQVLPHANVTNFAEKCFARRLRGQGAEDAGEFAIVHACMHVFSRSGLCMRACHLSAVVIIIMIFTECYCLLYL